MKLILILFFIISPVWSSVQLELDLATVTPKQGEIVAARLILKNARGQAALTGLKGKNFKKVVYLLNLSPFIGENGRLEADAKVIFLQVPETTFVSEVINGEEVVLSWREVRVIPTEASQSFLLGDFEIPGRKKIVLWISLFIALILISSGIFYAKRKYALKNRAVKRRKELKQNLLTATDYSGVVSLWQSKQIYLSEFPGLEVSFKKLEKTLFKYQFKPTQTTQEMQEVMRSYDQFKSDIMGVLNGV